jgi:hypothetical protein
VEHLHVTDQRLRLAIISSPRSGNSWLRMVIAGAVQLHEIAIHNYLDAPAELPARCLLQIHWYREPNFQAWLKSKGFQVITIARHPLDVLISALRFITFEPMTARWLEGNTGLPGDLVGAAPCSEKFLAYALSFGAENLLSISYQWWQDADSIKLRYEDIVQQPAKELGALATRFGANADSTIPWLEKASLSVMRALPNQHGWQGRPGLWRCLITPVDANKIFSRHRTVFKQLGYSVGPYSLTRKTALKNWREVV